MGNESLWSRFRTAADGRSILLELLMKKKQRKKPKIRLAVAWIQFAELSTRTLITTAGFMTETYKKEQ